MQFHVAPSSRWRAMQQAGGSGRRKRMAVVRLGGGGGRKRRLFGALRLRLRWPWLAVVYRRTLRRLRASYEQAPRELVEGAVLVGALHAPAGVDCTHAASFGPMATVGF